MTARRVRSWLETVGTQPLFIEPGSPWENGYCESFNGKLRDECLNGEIFFSLRKAQVVIEMWRKHYNTVRPHSALGYRGPRSSPANPILKCRRRETSKLVMTRSCAQSYTLYQTGTHSRSGQYGIDHGAVTSAEFSTAGVGLHLELLQCLHGWLDGVTRGVEEVGQVRIVVNTIEGKIVLERTGAVGGKAVRGLISRTGLAR